MISSSGIMIDTFEVMSLFMSLITRYRHSLSLSASQQKDCSVKKEKHDANRKKEKHQSEADFITGLDLITVFLLFVIFEIYLNKKRSPVCRLYLSSTVSPFY